MQHTEMIEIRALLFPLSLLGITKSLQGILDKSSIVFKKQTTLENLNESLNDFYVRCIGLFCE